jgi:hypothetical protein
MQCIKWFDSLSKGRLRQGKHFWCLQCTFGCESFPSLDLSASFSKWIQGILIVQDIGPAQHQFAIFYHLLNVKLRFCLQSNDQRILIVKRSIKAAVIKIDFRIHSPIIRNRPLQRQTFIEPPESLAKHGGCRRPCFAKDVFLVPGILSACPALLSCVACTAKKGQSVPAAGSFPLSTAPPDSISDSRDVTLLLPGSGTAILYNV